MCLQTLRTDKKIQIKTNKHDNILGWLMISPTVLGLLIFSLFPIIFSMAMSFTDWNLQKGIQKANFVGFKNYIDLFSDIYMKAALKNTFAIALVIPLTIFIAAILASVMNKGIWGKGITRLMYFLPYITSPVAIATVWKALFSKDKGPINQVLLFLGIPFEKVPGWLSSSDYALLALMIIVFWINIGYFVMLYSSALQNVSKELYEAADIDGANSIVKFFKVTLPMLKPTTFMLLIVGIIDTVQLWSLVQIMTNGGPGTATYTVGLYIYRCAFKTYRTGYACAVGWVLCAIVLTFTLLQWRMQKSWSNE